MKLREFLTTIAHVGDIIVIREYGWQIGMTRIDNDELYLQSLNPVILDLYNVVRFTSESLDWAVDEVLVVDILMDRGADNNEQQ